MRSLAEHSPSLALVLGEEEVEKHATFARTAADTYAELAKALTEENEDAVDRESDALGVACKSCHEALTSDGQTTFFDAFGPFVEELELPIGYMVIGLDIAPAPGDSGEWSQRVAAAFRAALVLANETR